MLVKFFKQDIINRQYASGLHNAVDRLIYDQSSLVLGHYTKEFENKFANYVNAAHCSFVSNGLDALKLALQAVGIKEGDTVIVPCHTYIATWLAPLSLGCKVIAVPVGEDNLLLDVNQLENYLNPTVKCIIPVHLYGNSCDMTKISQIAREHDIMIVEDAAQSHGAIHEGRMIGSWGDATCFSFYPTKNLGALGEAGAVCSISTKVDENIRCLRNYGRDINDGSNNILLGGNYRGDELQAAFLCEKLRSINQITKRRNSIVSQYKQQINTNKFIYGLIEYQTLAAPHLAILKTCTKTIRDNLISYLSESGIETSVHYAKPCHQQSCIQAGKLVISDNAKLQASRIADTIISIPMSEVHTDDEITTVSKAINRFSTLMAKSA